MPSDCSPSYNNTYYILCICPYCEVVAHIYKLLSSLFIHFYSCGLQLYDYRIVFQDNDGDTALHCAVLAQKNDSMNILLEAGADPTLLNFRLFTPIHEAARIGFLS